MPEVRVPREREVERRVEESSPIVERLILEIAFRDLEDFPIVPSKKKFFQKGLVLRLLPTKTLQDT